MLSECIYKVLMASGVVTSSDACDLSSAIETAVLEAQKQEPVAWCVAYDDPRMGRIHSNPSMCEPEVDTHVSKCGGVVVKVPLYAAPVVQPGYKLLKDTTHDERSWPEDSSHENGAYFCMCHHCGRQFTGYKRRVTCKVCAAVIAAAEGKK